MMRLFNVTARGFGQHGLVMIAPLETIVQMFQLHKQAIDRIEKETQQHATCQIHFNGRRPGIDWIEVELTGSHSVAAIKQDLGVKE